MVSEQYTKRVKGTKSTVWLYFIPKKEIIFVYTVKYAYINFQSIGINEILDHFPDIGTSIISFYF